CLRPCSPSATSPCRATPGRAWTPSPPRSPRRASPRSTDRRVPGNRRCCACATRSRCPHAGPSPSAACPWPTATSSPTGGRSRWSSRRPSHFPAASRTTSVSPRPALPTTTSPPCWSVPPCPGPSRSAVPTSSRAVSSNACAWRARWPPRRASCWPTSRPRRWTRTRRRCWSGWSASSRPVASPSCSSPTMRRSAGGSPTTCCDWSTGRLP
ncbi:MAG: hypothetical protein AVDCRST_MAG53-2787, partial [uncultured Solirubrobacteraceae bacterium]